jgi:hypothetical protein
MPDLLKRLKASDPSKLVSKDTLNDKLREKYLHNIKDINYTLKYEKPTKVMKKIASQGSYSGGSNIYSNPYGSASAGGAGGGSAGASGSSGGSGGNPYYGGCNPPHVHSMGNNCKSVPSSMWSSMQTIWSFNRGCVNSYTNAKAHVDDFASNYANTYFSQISPCLNTLAVYCNRKDGQNAARVCLSSGDNIARTRQAGISKSTENTILNYSNQFTQGVNKVKQEYNKFMKDPIAYGIGAAKNTINFFFGG